MNDIKITIRFVYIYKVNLNVMKQTLCKIPMKCNRKSTINSEIQKYIFI